MSNKPYRGVNPWLLISAKFSDHRWLTFRQATELKAHVRSGEKSTMVVFWKFPEKKSEDDEEEKTAPILRYYNVFNVEQLEGLELPEPHVQQPSNVKTRNEKAEILLRSMPHPPFVEECGTEAWYLPEKDLIRIPELGSFESIDAYYATLFHELIHSTGHESRLNRNGVMGSIHFGSEEYSREELVAELGSAFCCATIGLDNSLVENSAAYIGGWLRAPQSDPRAILIAAGQAQKAADFIRGVSYL